ncbi:MAG: HlyD family efflux transporter periplasmic adaptor subunit [Verrucomicrobia bacterium]|nr:MAG: HlyD family efflux transporter periplasmic adaptor subunit [Verrucomicrobiota bacterium]
MKVIILTAKVLATLAILAGSYFIGIRILREKPATSASGEHGEAAAADYERGPHGGRMLRDGNFAVEVTIYEPDIPPLSRVYPFFNDKPIDPGSVKLLMVLNRFGDRVDEFTYEKQDDYLLGNRIVEEPHSFDVTVMAEYKGKKAQWTYDSYEGRTKISEDGAASVGLGLEEAGPRTIRKIAKMNGRIIPDENLIAKVTPRFPGIVMEATKNLGETVRNGQLLAVVESNQSLTKYDIQAPISGVVIDRDIAVGGAVASEKSIYTIADFSSLWIELKVHSEDLFAVEVGKKIMIKDEASGMEGTAEIAYISPFGSQETQSLRAIATLPNPEGKWRTGLFVDAEIVIDEREVPVAVKIKALQNFRDWDVVFMKDGETYEIALLELGERDGDWIEVISGLEAGTTYVTENAFVVKADVLKNGATHGH